MYRANHEKSSNSLPEVTRSSGKLRVLLLHDFPRYDLYKNITSMRAVNRQPGFRAGGHVETEQPQAMWRHCAFTRSPNATASAPSQCFCISDISVSLSLSFRALWRHEKTMLTNPIFFRNHMLATTLRGTRLPLSRRCAFFAKHTKTLAMQPYPWQTIRTTTKNLISNETYAPIWMLRMTQQNANAHT